MHVVSNLLTGAFYYEKSLVKTLTNLCIIVNYFTHHSHSQKDFRIIILIVEIEKWEDVHVMKRMFESLKIGELTVPNRFVVPAMVVNYCDEQGNATERYIAYHEAKAKGGWGLIITEDYAVDPKGKGFKN